MKPSSIVLVFWGSETCVALVFKGSIVIPFNNGPLGRKSTCIHEMFAFKCQELDVKGRDSNGKTALHHCVDNQRTDAAEILLAFDESLIDLQDDNGHTALHLATVKGNAQLVELLLRHRARVNIRDKEHHTVVHWATGLYRRPLTFCLLKV